MEHSSPSPPADLLPAELAEHTVESLYAMHGVQRPWAYWLILVGVIGALVTLPLVHVDVSVRAPGLVRSQGERAELKAAVTGRIDAVLVQDGSWVSEGQVLLRIGTDEIDERMRRLRERQLERASNMGDLQKLLSGVENPKELETRSFRQELVQARVQLDAYRLAEAKAGNELARYTTLAGKGIATQQEMDNAKYELERLRAESRLFLEQTRGRWASRLQEEQSAFDELVSENRRLEVAKALYEVRAPASGELLGLNGLSAGVQVMAGQSLGILSPDMGVLVESQVSSRDIGLVQVGQPVKMQIDAYPYTQWGMLDGKVEAIGGDLLVDSNRAASFGYFKVLIRPADTHLTLPNGVRGDLKKGLTLTARYVVARRSLLQILYEDANGWLNPQSNFLMKELSPLSLLSNPAGE